MWRQIFSDESKSVPGSDMYNTRTIMYSGPDWLWVRVADVTGKHIRVTVEEEVSECCEKWRAGVAVACDWYDDTTSPKVGGVRCVIAPDFCAKCGKKL